MVKLTHYSYHYSYRYSKIAPFLALFLFCTTYIYLTVSSGDLILVKSVCWWKIQWQIFFPRHKGPIIGLQYNSHLVMVNFSPTSLTVLSGRYFSTFFAAHWNFRNQLYSNNAETYQNIQKCQESTNFKRIRVRRTDSGWKIWKIMWHSENFWTTKENSKPWL